MTTFLAAPEQWFEIQNVAASSARAGLSMALTLADADGHRPLAGVSLDELRAVHQTFGAWWAVLGGPNRPSSIAAGESDRFLTDSRALLKEKAEAALASPDLAPALPPALLTFPNLDHALLTDSRRALGLFRSFLALPRSPSLAAWARERAEAADAVTHVRVHAWLRVVMQKVAVEDELPEVLGCLRGVYSGEAARRELLMEEAQLLEQSGHEDLLVWARRLGLDRSERSLPGISLPPRRSPAGRPEPDVTVLVPSYRHEGFIEAAIESVLAQTHPGHRVLVMDDQSPDGTVDRARRIDDPRLQVHVNETNLGLGDTLLRALDEVTTPYVAILNSDDLFHPERLARCRAVLETSAKAQVVATGIMLIDAAGRRLSLENVSRLFDGADVADWIQWFSDRGHTNEGADLVAELLERNFLVTSSNIVCRSGFLRSRADRLRGLKYCFDWQVFLDAAIDDALVCLPEALIGYRLHRSNTVWFDGDSRPGYELEVNRVLAGALRETASSSSPRRDARDVKAVLELLTHAAKHSQANGLLLYACELLGGATLEEAAGRPGAVGRYLASMADMNASAAGESQPTVNAGRALTEAWREEATVAGDSDRWARAQLSEKGKQVEALESAAATLRSSPELLIGQTLWHTLHLSRVGLPAARALGRLRDRRNRWRLTLGRAARRMGLTRPRAVVAACWQFPIPSQTFVYQEMQALEWAGLDCRVFCCATNARSGLHSVFDDLWRKRVVLRPDWSLNERDRDHFLRTRPERVEAFLARLGQATGLTRDALLQQSIVMMGFTFARYVELSGAEYLHTYFFYDQSFMALMAACILAVPRGITAYADHMMQDYPFKCVALHLECADIIVATSRRIRSELSAIGGGRFDDKILVKPNGIDTARFPLVGAADRLNGVGEPELISVSRIEPKKGLIYLVEALGILAARGLAVRLNIVGGVDPQTAASGSCFRELTAKIEELGLSGRVVLHGARTQHEFGPLLARSRIFVAPYVEVASGDKDGIPTAVLEAMSTGLPIVATDAGSLAEAVTDGVEGISVPQRDPGGLADAIERLLTDPALYDRMSERARHRAVSEFDVHVTERQLHERIRACLDSRAHRPSR